MNILDRLILKFGRIKMTAQTKLNNFREKHNEVKELLPIVADLGGRGKGGISYSPGWGKVKMITVNLFDEADIQSDVTKLDEIENGSLDGIYSSHLIEHIWWWEVSTVLETWHKKLKPNSRIEIRCPDFEWIFKKSLASKNQSHVWEDILLHNTYGPAIEPWHQFYQKDGQHHRNLFWRQRLADELRKAGFKRVRRIRYFLLGLDRWLYDLRYEDYHGKIVVKDLVMEAYVTKIESD
jgi:hypothetical protein